MNKWKKRRRQRCKNSHNFAQFVCYKAAKVDSATLFSDGQVNKAKEETEFESQNCGSSCASKRNGSVCQQRLQED